ncbi:UxaA family hydrolase [Gilvimarinus sp. SDUM040013]|uniref:UxaA family hydrolase n=1 Tax=Gilvimarinus gilvus TaxID=3058038 RepID=A0ABU4S288_9GAMM|nr:UxaA family hydrolase [Gilvimarinus sp. SDUM040013]MDO3384941.1 UxaA family hydrolase [Gilvimarinus sp. SDUM040013]MDX6851263.1 UxaA family hydrolase [Gilvimarinus sp. SDUM040013]
MTDNNAANAPSVVLLHPDDNVLISVCHLAEGAEFDFHGQHYRMAQAVPIGNKIARVDMPKGTKIFRYGAPIGSLFATVQAGAWVHMHNLKSDYLASHTRTGRAGQ